MKKMISILLVLLALPVVSALSFEDIEPGVMPGDAGWKRDVAFDNAIASIFPAYRARVAAERAQEILQYSKNRNLAFDAEDAANIEDATKEFENTVSKLKPQYKEMLGNHSTAVLAFGRSVSEIARSDLQGKEKALAIHALQVEADKKVAEVTMKQAGATDDKANQALSGGAAGTRGNSKY